MTADLPEILFNGEFAVDTLGLVKPGSWYIGVRSGTTNKVYAILPDPTDTGRLRIGGDGTFAVRNPESGDVERVKSHDLIVFQAATARPQESVDPQLPLTPG